MKAARKNCTKGLARALANAAIAPLLAVVACLQVTEQYESTAEARAAGYFERGWLPDVLPDSAGPIIGVHDLDTNASCSSATIAPKDTPFVQTRLSDLAFKPFQETIERLPLRACPFSLHDARNSEVYSKKAGDHLEFAGIDRSSQQLLFWAGHPDRLTLDRGE